MPCSASPGGLSEEEFAARPCTYTVVNTNSPLQLDIPMALGIIDFARAGQLCIVTPFTLAGAMAPITVLGALVQQHAEALAGLTLSQLVRPGAPVAYGAFTSNVDMRSGAPAFGTPECGEGVDGERAACPLPRHSLARLERQRLQRAGRAGGLRVADVAVGRRARRLQHTSLHGAGWLEGGLSASREKFMMDVEMLQMFAELFRPLAFSDDELGLDAIREVGPAAIFSPPLTPWRATAPRSTAARLRLEQFWPVDGERREGRTRRAHEIAARTLAAFEPPPVDAAIREELQPSKTGAPVKAARYRSPSRSCTAPLPPVTLGVFTKSKRSFGHCVFKRLRVTPRPGLRRPRGAAPEQLERLS